MPRYNIEHKNKYYIFSTISDELVAEFDTFQELQSYRKKAYGHQRFNNEKSFDELTANKMDFKEIITAQICGDNEEIDTIVECFGLLDKVDMLEVFKDFIIMYKEIEK